VIIALVLLSAFLHAAWNALLRLEPDKDPSLVAATTFATGFAMIVAGARWAIGEPPLASLSGLGFTVIAGLFEGIYFATLAAAMTRGSLGTVYTISRGGAVLAVWPLSVVLFSEVVTVGSTVGSVIVVAGLALSGLGSPGRGGDRRGAIGWAMLCAASIAGYHLGYKAALREAVNPSACFAVALGVSTAFNVVRMGRTGRRAMGVRIRQRWPRLTVIGLLCAGSFILLMEALARSGSGFVLTLRNTSVLFAAAMAWWIGERPTWRTLAGAGLVATGAAVMAW